MYLSGGACVERGAVSAGYRSLVPSVWYHQIRWWGGVVCVGGRACTTGFIFGGDVRRPAPS